VITAELFLLFQISLASESREAKLVGLDPPFAQFEHKRIACLKRGFNLAIRSGAKLTLVRTF